MSGDETRKWAAQRLGYIYSGGHVGKRMHGHIGDDDVYLDDLQSDADLAEAVRVKCLQDDALGECPSVDKGRVRWIWWSQGPLAFIQAVREVVE